MMRTVYENVELEGHVLIRRGTRYTHALEFTPVNKSFMRLRSWNAPELIVYPATGWTLLSEMNLKRAPARELWLALRKRGYWVWLGQKPHSMKEATCA